MQYFLKLQHKKVCNKVGTVAKEGRKVWEGKNVLGLGITKAPKAPDGGRRDGDWAPSLC